MNKYIKYLSLLLILIITACSDSEVVDPDQGSRGVLPIVSDEKENIPLWIYEEMSFFYYWANDLPTEEPVGDEDPRDYFYSLLSNNDNFSYVSDDAESIKSEISGTIMAQGFSPAFGFFTNNDGLFAVVEYVYPDSPADKAGLKRGDIILKINGEMLSISNFVQLLEDSDFSITLGEATNRGIVEKDESIFINAGTIQLDPVIHYEVKEIEGQKTGYLVFVDFIAGEDDKWLNSLKTALGELKAQGISKLILDLRYNPGGEISVANYLASAIAPLSVVENKEVLVNYEYNDQLEAYFNDLQGVDSPNLIERFKFNEHNLNLDELIVLTTGTTASASELVINGLRPYMNVTMIGEPTFGKFYGSYLLYNEDDPPAHNWAISPVVLKYSNVNGVTDFTNGLVPDIGLADNLLDAKPFGDESDPMLATAIAVIKGESVPSSGRLNATKPYTSFYPAEKFNRKNIFIYGSSGSSVLQ